ncbi:MAG: serine/threonine protein kinase [Planctomycetaceae bacterium]|nr:serine/threonine protein kinase [Planctomycetaceae bacterium]
MDITQVAHWEIERKLGAGGMGTVYLGKHRETGQLAAIKVLPASLAREEGFVERFKREIASMEKLKSPHIVEFYESGNEGDTYYYSMEYVDGETLTARLKRDKRIPWPEVIDLCLQICRALKAAHNSGIIHRDLKPSNLMIASDGTVKLADFGVAQVFASQKLTITGGIVGTAEYMSPEQAKGQRATKKSDLYSLGAVMYVMLTGRPPFSGKSSLDVIHKHQFGVFDRPGLIATDMPRQLEEIVCKLLEKDPDKRFPDSYVLSLRLAEIQKRFAWQAAQNAAAESPAGSASSSIPNLGDATEAGNRARAAEEVPLAPTVLIPDPFGQQVPLGATIPTPAALPIASAHSPVLGATLTSPSGQRSQPETDATRHLAGQSQGPGTIMRNLMRKAITEQQVGGVLARTLDKFWVQVAALVLLVAVCVWLFLNREPTQDERFKRAESIMAQVPSTEWMNAKDDLEKLKDLDAERWQEKVDPYLRKIVLYETQLHLRTRRKEPGTTSEPERQLELARQALERGDDLLAKRKLEALLPLVQGEPALKETVLALLDELRDNRTKRSADNWLRSALSRAEQLAADNKPAESIAIWRSIIELYADDPDADEHVEQARRNLQSNSDTSKATTDESSNSETDSPPKAEPQ